MRAATAEKALRAIGHPEANVYPCCDDVTMPEGAAVWFPERHEGNQAGR